MTSSKAWWRLAQSLSGVLPCDVTQRGQVEAALAAADAAHPISSVFHLAGVLDDGLIERQARSASARSSRPRSWGRSTSTS